jgi:hypothetical protein
MSRRVAGSFPDKVFGICNSHNLSGRTVALWLTQPLVSEIFPGRQSWLACRADKLSTLIFFEI